jgi:hypothetical protein
MGRGGLPCVVGQNSHEAAAWRLGPAGKTARVAHGPRAPRACGLRVRWHGGALADGSTVAQRWQGVAGDLKGATWEVPGKEERAGAHRKGVPMVRRCKRHRAAVFNGGGVTPVVVDDGGWVLQFDGDPRVRRRWSIEGRSISEGHSPEGGGRGQR